MQGSSYLVVLLLLSGSLAGCTSSVTEPETTLGCTYPDALNFNESAVTDDGSCEYTEPPEEILGCMYEGATNYDEAATVALAHPEDEAAAVDAADDELPPTV